jgi:transcriptional regulator
MRYLSSVYSVTTHLHVSGLLVAHHQEVTMYIYIYATIGTSLTEVAVLVDLCIYLPDDNVVEVETCRRNVSDI